MSFWASSRRSFSGLASFCVRLWDGFWEDFCCGDDSVEREEADAKTGTACLPCLPRGTKGASKGRAPTIRIAMAVCLKKLESFIVMAEDFLRYWRLYLKASWTWMRRSSCALPARFR